MLSWRERDLCLVRERGTNVQLERGTDVQLERKALMLSWREELS